MVHSNSMHFEMFHMLSILLILRLLDSSGQLHSLQWSDNAFMKHSVVLSLLASLEHIAYITPWSMHTNIHNVIE